MQQVKDNYLGFSNIENHRQAVKIVNSNLGFADDKFACFELIKFTWILHSRKKFRCQKRESNQFLCVWDIVRPDLYIFVHLLNQPIYVTHEEGGTVPWVCRHLWAYEKRKKRNICLLGSFVDCVKPWERTEKLMQNGGHGRVTIQPKNITREIGQETFWRTMGNRVRRDFQMLIINTWELPLGKNGSMPTPISG